MSLLEEVNSRRQDDRPLVVILGPTAVGKTEIAIHLAERLYGEIISADSRLFYKGMDIGTAKPTVEERARVPHHLIDVANPDENWSLGLFRREAYRVIGGIHTRGRLPFLVGGTGQYLRSVIEGWSIPQVSPDHRLRTVLETWAQDVGYKGLHARLASLDPGAANQIDYRNLRRTVRALEVIIKTGQRYSDQRRQTTSPFRVIQLGLTCPRDELYRRIDIRIENMMQAGFICEVQSLLIQGYSPESAAFSAIGYREIAAFLNGEISLEEAVAQMKRVTRQFVRHQANWFKENDPQINWFRVGEGTVKVMECIIRNWLLGKE